MPDPQNDNSDSSSDQAHTYAPVSTGKKSSRTLLALALIFFAFLTVVFLAQREDKIDWIEDYQTGLDLAKQQNKPVLLAFYKKFTQYCSNMEQDTFKNEQVINFIEATFVPVMIDVDKQPQIARDYGVGYYPTHYIKDPHSDRVVGPHIGYDVPLVFMRKIEDILKELDLPNK
ncbi:MAG: thioredoxin family protein [Planctomycetota bacterium]